MDTLNLASMVQPVSDAGIFRDEDYFCWGPNILRDPDGRYVLVYSRWHTSTTTRGWLTDSEIAVAVSDRVEGPYSHDRVLLRGRGEGHWDELMAHNPKLKYFNGKYYLYYISSRGGPTFGHIRDSQRTGVAVADHPLGPYKRFEHPLIEPSPPIFNVAVNPGVTETPDGRFLFIIKGDIHAKTPEEKFPQRIQALGWSASPLGPVAFQQRPAIEDIDTEDASIWYDSIRGMYYAVFHAHTYIGLIASVDGINWERAANYTVTGKALRRTDGALLEPRRLERPSVYVEDGVPRALCLGAAFEDRWCCLILPLR